MNKITVKIGDKDYTNKVSYPFKFADLLDERLDEAYLTLLNVRDRSEPFTPLTLVEVTIECSPESKVIGARSTQRNDISQDYDSSVKRLTQTLSKRFVVATDKVSESPLGDTNVKDYTSYYAHRVYTHELYVIEETKILEGFIGDSLAFTNPLGNNYSNNNNVAPPPVEPEPTPEYTVTVNISSNSPSEVTFSKNTIVFDKNKVQDSFTATVNDSDNYTIYSYQTTGNINVVRNGNVFQVFYTGDIGSLTSNVTASITLYIISIRVGLTKEYEGTIQDGIVYNAIWRVASGNEERLLVSGATLYYGDVALGTATVVNFGGNIVRLNYEASQDNFFYTTEIGQGGLFTVLLE